MMRFIFNLLRPPSRKEWRRSWKGILVGAAFAATMGLIYLRDELNGEATATIFWHIFAVLFLYIIIFFGVIGDRIAESERNK